MASEFRPSEFPSIFRAFSEVCFSSFSSLFSPSSPASPFTNALFPCLVLLWQVSGRVQEPEVQQGRILDRGRPCGPLHLAERSSTEAPGIGGAAGLGSDRVSLAVQAKLCKVKFGPRLQCGHACAAVVLLRALKGPLRGHKTQEFQD